MSSPVPSASSGSDAPQQAEAKKSAFSKRFSARSRELKHALGVLSKDMQGSLGVLITTVENMDRGAEPDIVQLKQDLKEQIGRLNEGMSLLGTMLETNSSEILKYVKKRRDPNAIFKTMRKRSR